MYSPWLAGLLLSTVMACSVAAEEGLRILAMENKPLSFRNGDHADGMLIELVDQVQLRIGVRSEVELRTLARAITIGNVTPNVMVMPLAHTAERDQHYTYVGPIFVAYVGIFALKERAQELHAMGDDIRKLRAGARRGSIFIEQARRQGYNVTDDPVSSETAARMLMLKRFDLWFDGEELAGPALEHEGYRREDVEEIKRAGAFNAYFAFSNGTPESTIKAWTDALREMKRDGTFQRIYHKWMPGYPLPQEEVARNH